MIARAFGRLIMVPLGACSASRRRRRAGIARPGEVGRSHARLDDRGQWIGLLGAVIKLGGALFSVQALLLPLLLIIGGEVARIRHVAYYVAGLGVAFASHPADGAARRRERRRAADVLADVRDGRLRVRVLATGWSPAAMRERRPLAHPATLV